MRKDTHPVNTFIRIVRQPSRDHIRTYTGLKGWISHSFPEEHKYIVQLAKFPDAKASSTEINSLTCTTITDGDFCLIKPTHNLKTLQAKYLVQAQEDRKDEKLQKLHDTLNSTEFAARDQANRSAQARFREGKTNPYLPANAVLRFCKYQYPTFAEFAEAGHSAKQASIAAKAVLSVEDKVHLAWLNEASSRCSFWSDLPLVRALVKELDLDPMLDKFNESLYYKVSTQLVSRKQLRVYVIRQLNLGRIILEITGATSEGRVAWEYGNKAEATHFHVKTGQRRQLPAYA